MVDVGGMAGGGRGRVDEGRGKVGERAAFERRGTSCTRTTRPHMVALHPQSIKEGDYGSDCSSGVFKEGQKPAGLHVAIHQLQAPSTANGSFLLSKALLLVFLPPNPQLSKGYQAVDCFASEIVYVQSIDSYLGIDHGLIAHQDVAQNHSGEETQLLKAKHIAIPWRQFHLIFRRLNPRTADGPLSKRRVTVTQHRLLAMFLATGGNRAAHDIFLG